MPNGKIDQRVNDAIAKNKSETLSSGRFQNDSHRGRFTEAARAAVTAERLNEDARQAAADANAKVLAAVEALSSLQGGVLETADPDVRRQLGRAIAGLDREAYSPQWVLYGSKSK